MFGDRFEPFGDWWRGIGAVIAKIHNSAGKIYKQDATEVDFMPLERPAPRRQTPEEMQAILIRRLCG